MDEVAGGPRARLDLPDADGGGLLIRLGGELDLASLPEVQPALDRLLALAPQPVCVDLADLAFLDSTGVALLIRIANHFGTMQVVHAAPVVRRVVRALGLSDHLGLAGA